jgi:hypothetical protein
MYAFSIAVAKGVHVNPWTIVEIATAVIGGLFLFGGQQLDLSVLTYTGFSLMGLTAIIIGAEAMIRRRIILPSRYSRYADETYLGVAAFAQGIQFMLLGAFFIGVSILAYFNTGRAVFLQLVRRPSVVLLAFGVWCLATAVTVFAGYAEQKQGAKWAFVLDFITSRLLSGLILIVIGCGAIGLGLLEMVAPQVFDQMGGGFLEILFGAQ